MFHTNKHVPLAQSNGKINSIFACVSLKNLSLQLITQRKASSLPISQSLIPQRNSGAFYPETPPQILPTWQPSQSFCPSLSLLPHLSLLCIIVIDLTSPTSFSFPSFSLVFIVKQSPRSCPSKQQSFPLRRKERRTGDDYYLQPISDFIRGDTLALQRNTLLCLDPEAHGPAEDSGETHLIRKHLHHRAVLPSPSNLLPPSLQFICIPGHYTTFLKGCTFSTPTASSFGGRAIIEAS